MTAAPSHYVMTVPFVQLNNTHLFCQVNSIRCYHLGKKQGGNRWLIDSDGKQQMDELSQTEATGITAIADTEDRKGLKWLDVTFGLK